MINDESGIQKIDVVATNRRGWNQVAACFYGAAALPQYGPLTVTEDELNLIGDVQGKSVLELGCGSGHSLSYLAQHKRPAELWGLDLSDQQLVYARELLGQHNIPVTLIQASMHEEAGIPQSRFDLILSLYALGWTPDLNQTLSLVFSYLKPGGVLIFSWEHPVYRCLDYRADMEAYIFKEPYLCEEPEYKPSWQGVEIVQFPRSLSTFLNAVVQAGLIIERVVEGGPNRDRAQPQDDQPEKWYSLPRAELMPTTLIVKARKPT